MGREAEFFDIGSTGARQFGFCYEYEPGRLLAFCGDEPYRAGACPRLEEAAAAGGADWLLHEAFCLARDEARYDPHPINHGTVAEACRTAARLHARNLVLFHTEDDTGADRRRLYTEEGRRFFAGGLHVPEDGETLEL